MCNRSKSFFFADACNRTGALRAVYDDYGPPYYVHGEYSSCGSYEKIFQRFERSLDAIHTNDNEHGCNVNSCVEKNPNFSHSDSDSLSYSVIDALPDSENKGSLSYSGLLHSNSRSRQYQRQNQTTHSINRSSTLSAYSTMATDSIPFISHFGKDSHQYETDDTKSLNSGYSNLSFSQSSDEDEDVQCYFPTFLEGIIRALFPGGTRNR